MTRNTTHDSLLSREDGDHQIGFAKGPGAKDNGFGLVYDSDDLSFHKRKDAQPKLRVL